MLTVPNMSSETGVLKISPVNSHVVCLASIPDVPSNTYQYIKQFQKVKAKEKKYLGFWLPNPT
jgi:hypothetical protein